jgi:hypothetical protein
MKVVLQEAKTKVYLKSLDAWTADPNKALQFENFTAAAIFCAVHRLHGIRFQVSSQMHPAVVSALPQTDQITHFPFC